MMQLRGFAGNKSFLLGFSLHTQQIKVKFSDRYRIHFDISLLPLSFFENTPFILVSYGEFWTTPSPPTIF